jgi:hypothetical protein
MSGLPCNSRVGARAERPLARWAGLVVSIGTALPAIAAPPASAAPAAIDTGPAPIPVLHLSLPDAPEKRLVEQYCVACHDLARVQNAGGTRSGWAKRLRRMIVRGAKLPREDVPAVAAYLAREFPVRPRPVDTDATAAARTAGAP